MILAGVITLVATGIASAIGTRLVLHLLSRWQVYDHPTDRSSHTTPTPRGGGIAVLTVIALSWITIATLASTPPGTTTIMTVIGGGIILAFVSWKDDVSGLPVSFRLLVHIGVVASLLILAPASSPYLQGIFPGWFDELIAGILVLWFLNLFNFMDGIDGITGIEMISIGLGCAIISWLGSSPEWIGLFGLGVSGAAIGFLVWNWHPARVFVGDVGSIPIGFFLGWLLLSVAAEGEWAATIILPLYYLADATITLTRRAIKGEKIWQAHKSHFYQRAVQNGRSHAWTSSAIGVFNATLIGLAVLSLQAPLIATVVALIATLLFLLFLAKPVSVQPK